VTSIIASELHQPMSEILSWSWDEIVDRFGDAIELKRQAAIMAGAKFKG
jgi:hypothetical protein